MLIVRVAVVNYGKSRNALSANRGPYGRMDEGVVTPKNSATNTVRKNAAGETRREEVGDFGTDPR